MGKISGYVTKAVLTLADYVLGNDATGPTTKRFLLSDILTLILNNIPAAEGTFAFISTGMVWSGDAYASTRAASMTAGRVKVNTTFLTISAVTARLFTASKDTYVDVLDNLDGTGMLVYTEVTNNAASPALAANSLRVAIIVTGASNIAAAGSINQGQETAILPIASSIAYTVTDSLGNLINPRDQNRKVLGYRQITSSVTTSSTSQVQAVGLSVPVIVPTGRKIELTAFLEQLYNSGANTSSIGTIWDGTVASGTQLSRSVGYAGSSGNTGNTITMLGETTPAAASKTYNVGFAASATTAGIEANASYPSFLRVKLG